MDTGVSVHVCVIQQKDKYHTYRCMCDTGVSEVYVSHIQAFAQVSKVSKVLHVLEGFPRVFQGFPGFFQGYLGLSRVIPVRVSRVIQCYIGLSRVIQGYLGERG